MKAKIAISTLLKEAIQLIDTQKYEVEEFSNITQLKKIIENCDLIIFDLKQNFNKRIVFKDLRKINSHIKILGDTTVNKYRIAAKLLGEYVDDLIIFDKKNKNLINEKIEKLLENKV